MSKLFNRKPKAEAASPERNLPPGVLAVIDLEHPIQIGKIEVSHFNVRHEARMRELMEVQLAYERHGIILDALQVIERIRKGHVLAMHTLIDSTCNLESGTALELGESDDFWTAVKVITPFLRMLD